jgi:hypothetical protein
MNFINPLSGIEESSTSAFSWLWCFLFGPFYFAVKGNWKHVLLHVVFSLLTFGLSVFFYPFIVRHVNDAKYLRAGWEPVFPKCRYQR